MVKIDSQKDTQMRDKSSCVQPVKNEGAEIQINIRAAIKILPKASGGWTIHFDGVANDAALATTAFASSHDMVEYTAYSLISRLFFDEMAQVMGRANDGCYCVEVERIAPTHPVVTDAREVWVL